MLTVYCVYWRYDGPLQYGQNRYGPEHVYRLRDQVARYLPVEHRFVCITSETLDDAETVEPPVSYPGWWQKIGLFSSKLPPGPKLYFDLDVAIVGDLELLTPFEPDVLMTSANWAQSGHGGIQSSVMSWDGDLSHVCEFFNPASAHWPPINKPGVLWGDQEFITLLRDTGKLEWGKLPDKLIRSYKYHCKQGLPDDCRVVVFHGSPKPWEVNESWIS